MRSFENSDKFRIEGIKPHQILVAITTEPDWEMDRKILLTDVEELEFNEYLLLEGYHCSCYGFDDTEWQGTIYTEEELIVLANADYNKNNTFWQQVLIQIQ